MENIYLTHDGLDKLRKELDRLVNIERPAVGADLAQAREKGDLSENAEFAAAREKLMDVDRQIVDLQQKIVRVQILDENDLKSDEVRILSKVKITNLNNNKEFDYTIVDPVQADPAKRLISFKSPIAKGLLGKKVGDEVTISIPSGNVTFRIQSIEIGQGL